MRSKKHKIMRRGLQILLFGAILYLAEWGLALLLCKEPSSWGRRILNQIYQESSIDVCFIGGSQVLQGIDPSVASEVLGGTAVNLTSSQQPPAATAALVREALREHPEISRMYVSLDYSLVMAEDVNLESIYIVADAMKPSRNRLRYLLRATPQEYYLNSFLPLRKGESYATSPAEIRANLQTLFSEDYRNRSAVQGFADNAGMSEDAFEALAEKIREGEEVQPLADEEGGVALPERSAEAIRDILTACEEHGIQPVFFATPMPAFMTEKITDYDRYVQAVEELLLEAGALYYDYNTCISEASAESVLQFDRNAAENFTDEYHLSGAGARQFTGLLLESDGAR